MFAAFTVLASGTLTASGQAAGANAKPNTWSALEMTLGWMLPSIYKPNTWSALEMTLGWMLPSIYHRGDDGRRTPNIDRIGNEDAIFMTCHAEQSCTAGRNAFFSGMHPLRTGMIPPQTVLGLGGAVVGSVSAYIYDWNMSQRGKVLWLKELESYIPFPPLRSPESYNLSQVLDQGRKARAISPAGD